MRAVVATMIRTLEHCVYSFMLVKMLCKMIEHSAKVNARKKSGNSYYRSQVTIVFIRKSTKSPYILYDTQSKFYPTSRM